MWFPTGYYFIDQNGQIKEAYECESYNQKVDDTPVVFPGNEPVQRVSPSLCCQVIINTVKDPKPYQEVRMSSDEYGVID